MDLCGERRDFPRLLLLPTLYHAGVPPNPSGVAGGRGEFADLLVGELIFALADGAPRQRHPIDAMREGRVGRLFLLGAGERFIPAGDDPAGDLLDSRHSAEPSHPLFGRAAEHEVR